MCLILYQGRNISLSLKCCLPLLRPSPCPTHFSDQSSPSQLRHRPETLFSLPFILVKLGYPLFPEYPCILPISGSFFTPLKMTPPTEVGFSSQYKCVKLNSAPSVPETSLPPGSMQKAVFQTSRHLQEPWAVQAAPTLACGAGSYFWMSVLDRQGPCLWG